MDSNHTASSAKCWMSNFNLGAWNVSTSLTSSNTHVNTTVTTSDFANWSRTVSGSSSSYTNPKFSPASITKASADSYGNKYGTLYNYAAASAGTYVYASGAGTGNAQYDLCPSGWCLPTGGSSGEFKQLIADGYSIASSADGATALQSTLKFPLAGFFRSGEPGGYLGSRGTYWSSTRYDGEIMYYLRFNPSGVYPVNSNYRNRSYSIRCIAQ